MCSNLFVVIFQKDMTYTDILLIAGVVSLWILIFHYYGPGSGGGGGGAAGWCPFSTKRDSNPTPEYARCYDITLYDITPYDIAHYGIVILGECSEVPCLMDLAVEKQLLFQDPATPAMEGILNFHHDLMFFLIIIGIFVFWILVQILVHFRFFFFFDSGYWVLVLRFVTFCNSVFNYLGVKRENAFLVGLQTWHLSWAYRVFYSIFLGENSFPRETQLASNFSVPLIFSDNFFFKALSTHFVFFSANQFTVSGKQKLENSKNYFNFWNINMVTAYWAPVTFQFLFFFNSLFFKTYQWDFIYKSILVRFLALEGVISSASFNLVYFFCYFLKSFIFLFFYLSIFFYSAVRVFVLFIRGVLSTAIFPLPLQIFVENEIFEAKKELKKTDLYRGLLKTTMGRRFLTFFQTYFVHRPYLPYSNLAQFRVGIWYFYFTLIYLFEIQEKRFDFFNYYYFFSHFKVFSASFFQLRHTYFIFFKNFFYAAWTCFSSLYRYLTIYVIIMLPHLIGANILKSFIIRYLCKFWKFLKLEKERQFFEILFLIFFFTKNLFCLKSFIFFKVLVLGFISSGLKARDYNFAFFPPIDIKLRYLIIDYYFSLIWIFCIFLFRLLFLIFEVIFSRLFYLFFFLKQNFLILGKSQTLRLTDLLVSLNNSYLRKICLFCYYLVFHFNLFKKYFFCSRVVSNCRKIFKLKKQKFSQFLFFFTIYEQACLLLNFFLNFFYYRFFFFIKFAQTFQVQKFLKKLGSIVVDNSKVKFQSFGSDCNRHLLFFHFLLSTYSFVSFLNYQDLLWLHANLMRSFYIFRMFDLISFLCFSGFRMYRVAQQLGVVSFLTWVDMRNFTRLWQKPILHNTKLEIIWTLVPAGILLHIALPSLALLYALDIVDKDSFHLKILGNQWYWAYEYDNVFLSNNMVQNFSLPFNPKKPFFTYLRFESRISGESDSVYYSIPFKSGRPRLLDVDNHLILPELIPIRFAMTSNDVLHSWALPSAGIKVDACPGRLNQICVYFKRCGIFYGQCSEICGINHAFMPVVVEVVPADSFISSSTKFPVYISTV